MSVRKFEIVNVMSYKPHHVNMIPRGPDTSILICLICGILAVISTRKVCIVNSHNWDIIGSDLYGSRVVNIALITND